MTAGAMVITGGSRGIGAATAVLAARSGYDVYVGYRDNTEAAHNVVATCADAGVDAFAAPVDVTDEAVRHMSTRHGGQGGSIVNVSSAAAYLGSGGEYVDYAASKGAVDTMTIGLAREVATESVRVNAVRPGLIDTEIHASGGDPGRPERLAPSIPMGRVGMPEEVAETILWLASDAASYVTGALVNCSGGR